MHAFEVEGRTTIFVYSIRDWSLFCWGGGVGDEGASASAYAVVALLSEVLKPPTLAYPASLRA